MGKWLHRFSAQRLSAYGERNAVARFLEDLGNLQWLGNKVVKVVKKAPVFGHSVAEKVP